MSERCAEKRAYTEAGANAAMANIKHHVTKYLCEGCGKYHLTDARHKGKPYKRHKRRQEWLDPLNWSTEL